MYNMNRSAAVLCHFEFNYFGMFITDGVCFLFFFI